MQQLAQADAANAPKANLLLVIAHPVRQLIEDTAGKLRSRNRAATFIPKPI
jgi:hypothetical protein